MYNSEGHFIYRKVANQRVRRLANTLPWFSIYLSEQIGNSTACRHLTNHVFDLLISMIVSIMYFGVAEDGDAQQNEDVYFLSDAITSAIISVPVFLLKLISGKMVDMVAREEGLTRVEWCPSVRLYEKYK